MHPLAGRTRVSLAEDDLDPLTGRSEIMTYLGDMVKTHLERWKAGNSGTLPKEILYLRDGVSEGQYGIVKR